MSLLTQKCVLKLNRNWQAVDITTPEECFVNLCNETMRAMNIEYEKAEDGNYDFDKPINVTPVNWEEWIELEVRPFDLAIHTVHRRIRIPSVIVCSNYEKVPLKKMCLNLSNLVKRDKGRCQYSGKPLTKGQMSIDHIVPRSRGGKHTWTNVVICDKEINYKKGNALNEEVGLKLIKSPSEPLAIPVSFSLPLDSQRDWKLFL